jgi:hypothetical protein
VLSRAKRLPGPGRSFDAIGRVGGKQDQRQ